MKIRRSAGSLAGVLGLGAALAGGSGCLHARQAVLVRRDGSGTVTETVLVSDLASAWIQPSGARPTVTNSFVRCQDRARRMGPAVRLASLKEAAGPGLVGYQAVYAFDSIRDLRLPLQPDTSWLDSAAPPREARSVTFGFVRGPPARLTVRMPPPALPAGVPPLRAADRTPTPESMAATRWLLADLRVESHLKVEGTLVETDAQHVDDRRAQVTLLDLDVARFLGDDERFRRAMAMGRIEDVDTARARLQGMVGIRQETQEEITLQFR